METFDEIKRLAAAGDIARAEEALKELLAAEPENLEAKMLYGTCRQLLGDEETFKRIHGEIAPMMKNKDVAGLQPGTVSLWKKYHALWMTLILGGLVLAGIGYYCCDSIMVCFTVAPEPCTAYRGSPAEVREIRRFENTGDY